jgi:hypothetical protein
MEGRRLAAILVAGPVREKIRADAIFFLQSQENAL